MGRASFTTKLRPPRGWPFMPLMAACASASDAISTKPKPLERPVSRSIMTLALVTATKLTKRLFQIAITNGIRQIAHVQFVAHSGTP
jgi:hypothetical protein